MNPTDVEMVREKENNLKSLIAQQTKLGNKDVLVMCTASQDIACSVVLNTEETFDEQTIQSIVDDIINTFKQDSVELNVKKENIVITNRNNKVSAMYLLDKIQMDCCRAFEGEL